MHPLKRLEPYERITATVRALQFLCTRVYRLRMHLYVLSLRTLLLEASELQRASLSQKEYGESVSISTERKYKKGKYIPVL